MPTFDARGFPIYYETHGGGDGLPLIMIMGAGGTCQGWSVVTVPELSKDRLNLIFDNRGVGESGEPGGEFSTVEMAEDTLALLDHVKIEKAHVLGGFLGGLVAQELALAHPDRVQTLTLVGTCGRVDAKRKMLLELWKGLIENDLPRDLLIKNRLLWTLHDLTLKQEDLIERMVEFYWRDDAPAAERVMARQLQAVIEHDSLDRVEQIEVPTLLVCGEQDILTPPHFHRQLANRIPNSRLVLIPGAGHLVAAEMAPRFNRLVSRFLLEYDKTLPST
jgi:pimeloyl-ACP methyl ester carboxylesterase